MADPEGGEARTDRKIIRRVARTLTNSIIVLAALAVLGGWMSTGFYRLELGEEAVILRLGEHDRTVKREGMNWHWPEPIEYDVPVNVSGVRTHIFDGGSGGAGSTEAGPQEGLFIQTADKNIVSVTFDLQYTIDDAYAFVFTMAEPRSVLFESAQAAVRKVIGGMLVDDVLIQRKTEIEVEARKALIETLTNYASDAGGSMAFTIDKINLLDVQPPNAVRAAFQEVSSAGQDEERSISRAKGDAQEILERARAEAAELRERSEGYKEAKILEASGEAARFVSLYDEYARAPEVTRQRLYLETMEVILPGVEKIIIEPDTMGVMPLLQSTRESTPPPPPPAPTASPSSNSAKPVVKEPAQ